VDTAAYEFIFQQEHEHWWFRARRELIADAIQRFVPRGAPFLDVGCGTGALLARLGSAVEPWGIEPSGDAAARARARGITNVVEGDVTTLAAVPTRYFAGAGFFDVLEHLDDDRGAVLAARDTLRSDGVIVATVPAFQWLWSHHDDVHQHRRRYRRTEFGSLFTETGFDLEVLTYYNSRLFPVAAAARLVGKMLGLRGAAQTRTPPRAVNSLLERVFLSERRTLAAATTEHGFTAGLSVLAVARRRD
jgi:SAM-dependent methyltransferase